MKFVYFTHSLRSCWNHGNAHFLRGVLRELILTGHEVAAYEPHDAWSLENLVRDHGEAGLSAYQAAYPELTSTGYGPEDDVAGLVGGADVVIVHEWNAHPLVAEIGRLRAAGGRFTLLFHDTHHRAVSEPDAMRAYDLSDYDGVLAFGETLAEVYRGWGWRDRVFVWHEAADVRLFGPAGALPSPGRGGSTAQPAGWGEPKPSRVEPHPTPDLRSDPPPSGEGNERGGLVWIGNWGDEERSEELESYLFRPAQQLGLSLDIYGVRYPDHALATLARYGARYHGWAPNAAAPGIFARHLATAHVPRRFYVERLPGIPTIRVFEALACGIPLVSAPWSDSEHLFRVGIDFLMARNPAEMEDQLRAVRDDADLRASLIRHGLETILSRHTCAHRAGELLAVVAALQNPGRASPAHPTPTALETA